MKLLYRFRDIIAYFPKVKEVTWQWPRPSQGQFVIRGLGLLRSTCVPNLKCIRLPATKIWKATQNVKMLFLSHPSGDLGITHRVCPWHDGNRIVDFLLAIIKLFSPGIRFAAVLLREICRNRRFLKGGVCHFKCKF